MMMTTTKSSQLRPKMIRLAALLLMSAQAVGAFQQRVPTAFANTAKLSFPSAPSPVSKGRQHVSQLMSIDDISNYYATYPLQAAVVTCGVKASVADFIAQVRAWSRDDNSFEMRRNLAYILYGGIFIGMMCHIEYDFVFPLLFGTEQTLEKIAERVLFDVFISAPLMWLPPAYLVKAVLYNYSFKEGLEKYWADIKEGLLLKYWALWLPALSFSFSTVPDHLRVAFMAVVSFFWFIIFSASSAETEAAAKEAAASSDKTVVQAAEEALVE